MLSRTWLDDVERVGVGVLVDRHRAGRLAAEPAGGIVVLRVELDPGDVPEPDDRAVVAAADDDVLELADRRQPPLGEDRVLEHQARRGRLAADLAHRRLAVLGLDRLDHLGRRDELRGHPVRVEPDPHGVLPPERRHVADPGDPLQHVEHVDLARNCRGTSSRYRPSGETRLTTQTMSVDVFLIVTPYCLTSGGRTACGRLHAVLDVHRADVLRVPDVERRDDRRDAVARAVRAEVDHPLDAVDLLLDRRRHGLGHGLRIGAGVGRRDLDLRRA